MARRRNIETLPIAVQELLESWSAPVVTIFVRHSADCPHNGDESYRDCRCRKHIRWFQDGKQHRQSTSARSWEDAEKAKAEVEQQLAYRVRQAAQREQTEQVSQPSPAALAKYLVWEGGKRTQDVEQSDFYTPAEIAKKLKVSEMTVVRRFENFPGVIDLGSQETRYKRRYRILRIPREVFQKFLIANRVER